MVVAAWLYYYVNVHVNVNGQHFISGIQLICLHVVRHLLKWWVYKKSWGFLQNSRKKWIIMLKFEVNICAFFGNMAWTRAEFKTVRNLFNIKLFYSKFRFFKNASYKCFISRLIFEINQTASTATNLYVPTWKEFKSVFLMVLMDSNFQKCKKIREFFFSIIKTTIFDYFS